MTVPSSNDSSPDEDLGLDHFGSVSDDQGLSLEELSRTYAELISGGADPYQEQPEPGEAEEPEELALQGGDGDELEEAPAEPAEDACELTPRSIIEAVLFVGHPNNEPLTSRQIAAQMRGVSPKEVDSLIEELNQLYTEQGCPYAIVSGGSGYRMQLRDEFAPLREKFYGRIKEAQLSQAAIEVLAVLAYQPGLTREEIDQLRDKPSGGLLTQLVRRQLLRVDRSDQQKKSPHYYVTDRFLNLFGLDTLEDLPRSHELDRTF